ncbi:MAG TPA: DUF962 domain-containing protein [Candidatus Hydrogenedens sp.]|nr:DUF962 domain-containing protein [Candidatus Hydrogenedens sp.]HOK08397.1 DUF962 domain-containing protein [Candidatus Hydrogenedens sp.]HOL20697.1 DUF962 domain-containing protein [Candidatus Hydrogenedens sp.]HPP58190.1 DUF962 domain-containing protein [Candidatus Hydrogenedens sp.]
MKTLKEQIDIYAGYHKNPYNKLTHYFGIPIIIFSLLLFLSWLKYPGFPVYINGATIFLVCVFFYYFILDKTISFIMALLISPLFALTFLFQKVEWRVNLMVFLVLFVGGWILQFIGHTVFEKKKPAFTDNLIQLLIGPLFFVIEILRKVGVQRF